MLLQAVDSGTGTGDRDEVLATSSEGLTRRQGREAGTGAGD